MKTLLQDTREYPRGFATLLTVIVIGAIGTAVVFSFLESAGKANQNAFLLEEASWARNYSDSCAEIALGNTVYASSTESTGVLSFAHGNCSYTTTASSTDRLIESIGTSGPFSYSTSINAQTESVATTSENVLHIKQINWKYPL